MKIWVWNFEEVKFWGLFHAQHSKKLTILFAVTIKFHYIANYNFIYHTLPLVWNDFISYLFVDYWKNHIACSDQQGRSYYTIHFCFRFLGLKMAWISPLFKIQGKYYLKSEEIFKAYDNFESSIYLSVYVLLFYEKQLGMTKKIILWELSLFLFPMFLQSLRGCYSFRFRISGSNLAISGAKQYDQGSVPMCGP